MKKEVLLAVVVCLAATSGVHAQSPRWQQMIEIQVAPVHQPAFEDYILKIKEAAEKTESPVSWTTFQVVAGRADASYDVGLNYNTWAERDQWSSVPEMLTKAFGEQEAAQILRAGRVGIVSQRSLIWERLPDASSNPRPAGSGPANFYAVTIRHVKRDGVPEYREIQRTWKSAYEAVANGPSVGRSILRFGEGSNATFRRGTPFDRWGDYDASRELEVLAEQLGEEGSRLTLEARDRLCTDMDSFIAAYRPDLSRPAVSPTSD